MELTQEQIQRVENYLDARELDYIDVRMEVFDHIVCDIEQRMEHGENFECALYFNKIRWRKDLRPTSNWVIGLSIMRPKIVIEKAKKTLLYWTIINFLLGVFASFILQILSDLKISDFLSYNMKISILIVTISLSIYNLILYSKMKKTKLKTTFLFVYEKKVLHSFTFLAMSFLIFDKSFLFLLFSLMGISLSYFGFQFYKNNQKIVSKWS